MIVEDPDGNACRLAVHHYPCTLDASAQDNDQLFHMGVVMVIREPCYEFPPSGDHPRVRVDSPSDIIFPGKLSVPMTWVTGAVESKLHLPSTADGWKSRGVEFFQRQRYFHAAIAFSEGLVLDPTNALLLLNRSETYLRLSWFNSAAHDAALVMAMNLGDPILNRKAVVRATKAYYFSQK